jgi:ribose transport system permease protein
MTTVEATESGIASGGGDRLRSILSSGREYGIAIVFVLLFIALSIASPAFLTVDNLKNILDQNAAIGIMACAGTLLFIVGGFDLSIGAVFALAGVVAAQVASGGGGVGLAIAAGLGTGLLVGITNGVLTTVGRVNAFVGTLGSSIIVRGLALVASASAIVTVANPSFAVPGTDSIGPIKITVFCWLVFALGCGFILWRTTLGEAIFACGGNPEAARLSGVRVWLVRGAMFALSGFAAALAGILEASRVSTGQADAGLGIELTVIAAIVVGGTSIYGGSGAIWRTTLGVMLLALIGNGFTLLGVAGEYQQILEGGIILGAVSLDAWARRSS